MTVKEVIELLQKMPPETPVRLQQNNGGYEDCRGISFEPLLNYFNGITSDTACLKVD